MKRALLSIFLVTFSFSATAAPKYGPSATRLVDSQEYVRKNRAPDYWALVSYYLPQRTGSACSSGTVAMVVNAARVSRKLTAADELATEEDMLKRVKDDFWTDRTASRGGGVGLDQLAPLVIKALAAYGVEATVETVHANEKGAKEKLHRALVENEKGSGDFIISNFLQSAFTGDPEGAVGHFAPVAAYDGVKKRVLIFDPDRKYYEPYWVSEETFFSGMNTQDRSGNKTRGWLWVKTKPEAAQ